MLTHLQIMPTGTDSWGDVNRFPGLAWEQMKGSTWSCSTQHTQHAACRCCSGSAQELRTSRRFIAMLLNINTSIGIMHRSQHTDCSCLILHTNKNCIQFLVQNTKVEKKRTCYYCKGRNRPAQFAGLVMQDAATLRPITTCISLAPKWQDHTSCVFHALHQYDTAVTVYFHRTEGKYSFCNTSGPWT